MLEFLRTGKALSVLAAIGVIGLVSKFITQSLYKRLLKETDNMAMTKNKNLKILKQKLENAYRLNQNIVNTQAYLDKQLYGFKFMNLTLTGWNNISIQMTILSLLAGGIGSFMSYWYRLDSYYIVLYASVAALGSLLLAFLDSSFNIPLKQQRLSTSLLEYVDNSIFVRAARENAGTGRDASSIAARIYSSGSRPEGTDQSYRGVKERETAAANLSAQEQADAEREQAAQENALRDGLIREEEPRRLSARTIKTRNAKAGELLRTVRSMKDEENTQSSAQPEISSRGSGSRGSGSRRAAVKTAGGKSAGDSKVSGNDIFSGNEREMEPSVRRDIDYLKHSLEQIAASKEQTKKEEDWTKNLGADEMKVLGEIMRQYFSGN